MKMFNSKFMWGLAFDLFEISLKIISFMQHTYIEYLLEARHCLDTVDIKLNKINGLAFCNHASGVLVSIWLMF